MAATGTMPRARSRTSMRAKLGPARLTWLLATALLAVFFALPLIWLLLAPTKPDSQLLSRSPLAFGSIGSLRHAWHNLVDFQDGIFFTWLGNSVIYAAASLVLTLVTAIPAGYGLAVFRFPGRRLILATTLIVMLVPTAALTLPLFLEMSAVGQIDSMWSVVLPYSFFPFGVYLAYIYFSTSLPPDILEAARVDGCGNWMSFRHIALPLAKPIVALVSFFSVTTNWNNFFLPFVMLPSTDQQPVQVGLNTLLTSTPAFNPTAGGAQLQFNRPELALAILIAILPIMVVFLVSQRALVSGMLVGATKE